MKLPEAQVAVLEQASASDPKTIEQLAEETGHKPETVTGAAFELVDEGLLVVEERTETDASITAEGAEYVETDLPEVRLYRAAFEAGAADDPVSMGQVIGASGLDGPAVDIALSNYARKGYGTIESGEIIADPDADPDEDVEAHALEAISSESSDTVSEDVLGQLDRRGLVEISERTVRSVTLTQDGVDAMMLEGAEVAERVDRLTPELLTSGEWEDVEFADYNVEADAAETAGGKVHILRQTAERVKDVLVGMGFREMEGPHADADFWINDCLFMPQDHPARTQWDRFSLERPDKIQALPDDLVERVRDAHRNGVGEEGEGYHAPWDLDFARSIALRGHTTSLSMRYLSGHAEADIDPPKRYFSVEKVYRNDTLDPTHLLEFFQIEGWVLAEDLSVRDL
ncbi:MAG: phenylalanyl-tRNA synthetase alpha chain, partial [Halobacteriales archaeon]